ncbi:MAG TPA: zf-HC2 domain-containing protein [Solirubrobacterales bacterium]
MGTLLSRYVDGELADKERKSIESHLETCASCRDVLNLFQRNDNVLNNALVGEAFGAQTVDAVMTEIRRLEEPMVVAPAVEDDAPAPPVAMRQVIQVTRMWPFAAAAALMLACFGGFFAIAKFGGGFGTEERTALKAQVDLLRKSAGEDRDSAQAVVQVLVDRVNEVTSELRDLEIQRALPTTKESTALAYVGSERSIVVQANFSTEKFGPFQVFRVREISDGKFEDKWTVLRDGIPTPYYVDTNIEAGVRYMYQVRAIYRATPDKHVDSAPVVQMIPFSGGLDPRTSLRIRLIGVQPDQAHATFEVSRHGDGKLHSQYYTIKIGEKIGDVQEIDGKRVDFSTRLTLHSVQWVEEAFPMGPIPLLRMTRQANLKGDQVKGFPVRLGRDEFIPLPK